MISENSNKKFNGKTKDIIESARALFWKFGIRRTTVEEICVQASCSKMTFYRNFRNKEEVAQIVINLIAEDGQEKYREIMASELAFSEKIHQITRLKKESTNEISHEFLHDILNGDNELLRGHLESFNHEFNQEILHDFKKAQKDGEIRADINIEFALAFSQKIGALADDPELHKYFGNSQDLVLAVTDLFFYGIGGKK